MTFSYLKMKAQRTHESIKTSLQSYPEPHTLQKNQYDFISKSKHSHVTLFISRKEVKTQACKRKTGLPQSMDFTPRVNISTRNCLKISGSKLHDPFRFQKGISNEQYEHKTSLTRFMKTNPWDYISMKNRLKFPLKSTNDPFCL